MTTVVCKHCEHTVPVDTCWCVIDTKTKERFYECKVNCVQVAPTPETIQIQLDDIQTMADTIERQLEATERTIDWVEAYPKRSFFQRVRNWFSTPSGYTKVKTS